MSLNDVQTVLSFAYAVFSQYQALGRDAFELKRRVDELAKQLRSCNEIARRAKQLNLAGPDVIANLRATCCSFRKALEEADAFVRRLKKKSHRALLALVNSNECKVLLQKLETHLGELNSVSLSITAFIAIDVANYARAYPRVPAASIPASAPDFTRELLTCGKYIDTPFPNGNTPLHHACRAGDMPLIRLLLWHGADPAKMTLDLYRNALHLAAASKRTDILAVILTSVAPGWPRTAATGKKLVVASLLQQVDAHQNTLLHTAVRVKSASMTEYVAEQLKLASCTGAFHVRDDHGRTALQLALGLYDIPVSGSGIAKRIRRTAARVKIADIVAALLKAGASFEDARDGRAGVGRTVLHTAVEDEKLHVVKALLVRGSSGLMDARDGAGRTALEMAVKTGHVAITKALLRAGASVQASNKAGMTLLQVAAMTGNTSAALTLLQAGFPCINAQDSEGQTALFMAAEKGHVEIERALLDHRASIRIARFQDRKTALHAAVENNHVDAVKVLISKRATIIDICDNTDKTALHVAAARGLVGMVKLIVARRSAVVDARSATGKTALHIAAAKDRNSVIDALVCAGANLKIKDNKGRSAMSLAEQKRSMAAMVALTKAKREKRMEKAKKAK